jgi:polyisoprenyl-phosphate glycosyltransferase
MNKQVTIVIPVCNEEDNVAILVQAIDAQFAMLPYKHEIIFADDGSKDNTLNNIKGLAAASNHIFYISLSRNFGHQNALKAGLDIAHGDCVISMDGDMQHPPSLIPVLLQNWEAGFDIVYTIRNEDKDLSIIKRKTSSLFYALINRLSDIELDKGAADFRLMSRRSVDAFKKFGEHDLFIRGLVDWLGFTQIGIEYYPAKRLSGTSKYTLKKMIRFALQGITSFSVKPLHIATYLGFIFSLLSILYIPYALWSWYYGNAITGWVSVIVTIAFFGGLQLMILGIIGMYLGKLFVQSKQRPHYIIKETNLTA